MGNVKTKGKRIAIAAGLVALVVIALAVVVGWPRILSWYRFTKVFESLGKNTQGFPEFRHRQTRIVMVLLPGGKFLMGAQKTDPKGPNYNPEAVDVEGPVHEVTVSPFLIGKYELTQGQWKSVMGENNFYFKGEDDRPTERITLDKFHEFEVKTSLTLPTEAQWEYACRGGTTPLPGSDNLDEIAWYSANSGGTTHPVGKKAPNGFGLHDTIGNIWEFVKDIYDEGFYKKPEARETDPISVRGSEYHSLHSC